MRSDTNRRHSSSSFCSFSESDIALLLKAGSALLHATTAQVGGPDHIASPRQSQDREDVRDRHSPESAGVCRPSDRVVLTTSEFGTLTDVVASAGNVLC